MSRQYPLDPPDSSQQTVRSTTFVNKRKFNTIYDPTVSEQFPNVPWYSLDYRCVASQVNEILDEIILKLGRYTAKDPDIKNLVDAATREKELPNLEKCCVAVLGDQGSGKSTLISALMGGRKLLDRSGDSKTCTSIPVVIRYKKGADDNTQLSDVSIEWMEEEERAAHISEQIRRWTDVYSGAESEEEESEEQQDGITSDTEEEEKEEEGERKVQRSRKSKENNKTQDAASTAKEFFDTVFNTEADPFARDQLEERLYNTDIRHGGFEELCLSKVAERFQQLRTQLNLEDNTSNWMDVHDKHLRHQRCLAKKLWPFVKVFTIATGHMLLRYGICFFDLPGFGDTNQLRAAHINKYRWKADIELIVAQAPRIQTNKILNRHLADSVHLKGPDRTMLVMNKSDALIDEITLPDQICNIPDHPFPALYARLEHIDSMVPDVKEVEDEDTEDEDTANKMNSYQQALEDLTKEATIAYVKRETRLVQDHFQAIGVTVHAASAIAYLGWKNRLRSKDPILDPESSGIPDIIRFLLRAPASTNLKNYHRHVHKNLPLWRKRALRVLEKHTEDECYAAMRHDVLQQIPLLGIHLNKIAVHNMMQRLVVPWEDYQKPEITIGIKKLFKAKWKHPNVHYSGFAKMVRENGIPVNGLYFGQNFNRDLSTVVSPYMKEWASAMREQVEGLARRIHEPIREFLANTQSQILTCTAVPSLMKATIDALEDVTVDIQTAYDILLDALRISLNENYLRFTTEMDIKCPIAQGMRTSYKCAQDPIFVRGGRGVYNRARLVLQESIIDPSQYHVRLRPKERQESLIDRLKIQLVKRQSRVWTQECTAFITDAIKQLEEFLQTMNELLIDAEFMTLKHWKARAKLEELLVHFDSSLLEIQNDFKNLMIKEEPRSKKVKNYGKRVTRRFCHYSLISRVS